MDWEQVRGFNQGTATKIKNLCLGNVQSGFGIPGKYPTAWEAWLHIQQHTDPIPTGVDVPVYFSYTATIDGVTQNYGHIGVRLANGTFWSDGTIYPSIEAYTQNHLPRYVGWGESVNDVTVIKQGEGVLTMTDEVRAVLEDLKKHILLLERAIFGDNVEDAKTSVNARIEDVKLHVIKGE